MDVFQSWLCECASNDMAYRQCKLGIDYMSGCFYLDQTMMEYIKDMTICKNDTNEYVF